MNRQVWSKNKMTLGGQGWGVAIMVMSRSLARTGGKTK